MDGKSKHHGKRQKYAMKGRETPHLAPNGPPLKLSNSVRAMRPLSDHIKGQRRPVDKSISPSEEAQRKHGLRESRSI